MRSESLIRAQKNYINKLKRDNPEKFKEMVKKGYTKVFFKGQGYRTSQTKSTSRC